MPNYDVWYPLGISATLYSLMTIWLAIKRLVMKIRKRLGLPVEQEGSAAEVPRKIQVEYPIISASIKPARLSTPEVPRNDM